MIEVRRTAEFDDWLHNLRDTVGKARILKRLQRAEGGNLGDVSGVGEGVMEMRLFFGPGYRLYYVWRGEVLIVMFAAATRLRRKPISRWPSYWQRRFNDGEQD